MTTTEIILLVCGILAVLDAICSIFILAKQVRFFVDRNVTDWRVKFGLIWGCLFVIGSAVVGSWAIYCAFI